MDQFYFEKDGIHFKAYINHAGDVFIRALGSSEGWVSIPRHLWLSFVKFFNAKMEVANGAGGMD